MLKTHHEPLVEAVNDELYETQQNKFEVDTQVSTLQETFLKMIDEFGYKMVQEEEAEQPTDNVIEASEQFSDAIPYVEEETITANEILEEEEIGQVVSYVQSISGQDHDANMASAGATIFADSQERQRVLARSRLRTRATPRCAWATADPSRVPWPRRSERR